MDTKAKRVGAATQRPHLSVTYEPTFRLEVGGTEVPLTELEAKAFEIFAEHVNEYCRLDFLAREIYGLTDNPTLGMPSDVANVRLLIHRLRKKLSAVKRGAGRWLESDHKGRCRLVHTNISVGRQTRKPLAPPPEAYGILPKPGLRWITRRKATIVAAIEHGRVTSEQVLATYPDLSPEELQEWQSRFDRGGMKNLRVSHRPLE